jgi:succinate-acetate transporter protein
MGLCLFYGGVSQVLAGMWDFYSGNTFNATLFSSYGAFFMSLAALRMSCFSFLTGYVNHEKDYHDGMGIYYLGWTFFSLWMTVASHRTSPVLMVFLLFVFVQFLMLSISEFTNTTYAETSIHTQEAAGSFGVMAAFFGWYAAYASLLSKKVSLFSLPAGSLDNTWRSWGLLGAEEKAL